MTKKDRLVLIEGLKKLAADVTEIATLLEGTGVPDKKQNAEAPKEEAPIKVYSYEDARAVLAEKARTGYRAEVKSILTAHGLKQLSDVNDPADFAAIIAEAEVIGNG